MVILINTTNKPFKVQYKNGGKLFVKKIPSNKSVAMKGLNTYDQISNKEFLAKKDIIIYNYGSTYYSTGGKRQSELDILTSTLTPILIGRTSQSITQRFYGSVQVTGMTFSKSNLTTPTIYGFTTSANTLMATGSVSANTIGNNIYISFSGDSVTTLDVQNALNIASFNTLGITVSGGRPSETVNTGTTIFYLSATTQDNTSMLALMSGLT